MPALEDGRLEELRDVLAARGDELAAYRDVDGEDVPWQDSPAGSDAGLRRFLTARKGDVGLAADMFSAHLRWRQAAFPIAKAGKVGEILDDGSRYSCLGNSASTGAPVIMTNFLWGNFLTDEFPALACLKAFIRFFEEQLAVAEEEGVYQSIIVCFGGPPPMAWAGALNAIMEANYPERLQRAVIYPVPRIVSGVARAALWIMDENTRAKVRILSDDKSLMEDSGLSWEEVPDWMLGGHSAVQARFKPDGAKIMQTLKEGFTNNRAQVEALQQEVLGEMVARKEDPPGMQHEVIGEEGVEEGDVNLLAQVEALQHEVRGEQKQVLSMRMDTIGEEGIEKGHVDNRGKVEAAQAPVTVEADVEAGGGRVPVVQTRAVGVRQAQTAQASHNPQGGVLILAVLVMLSAWALNKFVIH